ncbi:UNVERIFIED_CONTAM: hypothetical protein Sindi_1554000 [Sesamum indicum]
MVFQVRFSFHPFYIIGGVCGKFASALSMQTRSQARDVHDLDMSRKAQVNGVEQDPPREQSSLQRVTPYLMNKFLSMERSLHHVDNLHPRPQKNTPLESSTTRTDDPIDTTGFVGSDSQRFYSRDGTSCGPNL